MAGHNSGSHSLIITVGLLPYVEAMVARGLPRAASALLLVVAFISITIGLFSLVVPAIIDEFNSIQDNLPDSGREVDKLLANLGIDSNLEERARDVDWSELISGRVAVNAGQRVLTATFSIITVVVMTAYLLVEMPNLARFIFQFVPKDRGGVRLPLPGDQPRGRRLSPRPVHHFDDDRPLYLRRPANPGSTKSPGLRRPCRIADIIPVIGAFIAIIPPVAAALQESSTQALIVLALLMAYQQFKDRFSCPECTVKR